ncbi:MAG: hypothetical protein R3208_02615 [Ketobacteraceae bacterium]|nr:hypothetical protein [Ketobacteraceae bacterium]
MNPATKISTILKNEGLRGVAVKVFQKVIYRRQTITLLKRDLHKPVRKFKTSKRWQVREFTENDLQFCRGHFSRYINDYRDLFAEKFKAFAAFEHESQEVIAIAWYAPRDFYDQHYHHYTFRVEPHQVFQFAGEVAPEYRNTQVSVNVMQGAWDYWKEHGKQEVLCTVNTTNVPSLRLVFHLEWEETGQLIHFHRSFGIYWQSEASYQGERFDQFKKKHRRREESQNAA